MGICSSCEATATVTMTANLVLPDGKLQEFDRPVKVSQVLLQIRDPDHLTSNNNHFVCNSDEMEFNGSVSAMGADEELQMGQLYFLLPQSMLKKPLHADDMTALAVKASTALMKAACRHRTGSTCRQALAQLQYQYRPAAESIRPTHSPRSRVIDHAGHQGSGGHFLRAEAEITISSTSNINNNKRRQRATGGGGRGRRHFQSNLGPILE